LALVGALGAVLAWLAIGAIGEVFRLPPELARLGMGGIPGPDAQRRIGAGNLVLYYKHSALWLAVVGGILGALFGLTLGLLRRSGKSVLLGVVAGALCGNIFGACAGPLAVYIDQRLQAAVPAGKLTVPEEMRILMHAATWLVLGLGIGLGTGLAAPVQRGRAAVTALLLGAVAGLLGGVLYPVIAGIALPLANISLPIPEADSSRLLWLGLPSVLIGLALGRKG
jgi:hypothetical protein